MPSHVKNKKTTRKNQKVCDFLESLVNCVFFIGIKRVIKIKIESNNAKTPPNLFGMARRIA